MLFLKGTTSLPSLGICLTLFAACSAGDTPGTVGVSPGNTPPAAVGTTVQVSVTASDDNNDALHYRWAATNGTITDVDAPKTTWVVPPGSGLQFAYVLVSDGKGGYTESRAAVMTQGQALSVATATVPVTNPTGGAAYLWGALFYNGNGTFGRNIYLPKVTVHIVGPDVDRTTDTDMKGEFFFSGLEENTVYSLYYIIPGRPEAPFTINSNQFSVSRSAGSLATSPRSYIKQPVTLSGTLNVAGSVRLTDRSFCGVRDEFFFDLNPQKPNALKKIVSAEAQLLTANNGLLSDVFPVNHYGDYLIVRSALSNPTDVKVRISCEQGNAKDSILLPDLLSGDTAERTGVTLDNSRPVIKSMTVLLNGRDVGRPDLPKPRTLFPKFPGDTMTFTDTDLIAEIAHTPGDDAFLTYKGLDSRKSACAYYRALRAVEGCDPISGSPTGKQLTLDQWKQRFNLSPFPTGNLVNPRDPNTQEVRIIYINRADLNFARDMQAVRLSDGSIAYNVCNYAGPQNTEGLGEPVDIGTEEQPNINLAIDNARRGIGMVACVAMDYSADPLINNGVPFTKFYSFGPDGQLLLSVSLDGRREKFMPGSCTACHGGDFYGGRFPEDGSGRPDMGSRWQPFDMANLNFSEIQQKDKPAIEAAIKQLNQMMVPEADGGLPPVPNATINLIPVTTPRTKELINGWYVGGTLAEQNTAFVPSSYNSRVDLYRQVAQGMCQTCHATQKLPESFSSFLVCGGGSDLADNHVMTNALVPFERFWRDSSLPKLAGCPENETKYVPAKHPPL